MAPNRKHLRRRLEKAVLVYIQVWDAVKRMRRRTRMTLTQAEYEQVNEEYNLNPMLDTNQDILHFLRKLGQNISDSDLQELFDSNGFVPGSTIMTLDRMVRIVETLKRRHHDNIVPDTVEAFAALGGSKSKKGTVDVMILKRAVEAFDLTIDIDAMIMEVDEDNDGHVDFQEFSKMFATEGDNLRRLQEAAAAQGTAVLGIGSQSQSEPQGMWPRRHFRHSIPSFSQLLPDEAEDDPGVAKGRRAKAPGQHTRLALDGAGQRDHGAHDHLHTVRGKDRKPGGPVAAKGQIDVGQDIAQLRERLLMSAKPDALPLPTRKDLKDDSLAALRDAPTAALRDGGRRGRLAGLNASEASTGSLTKGCSIDPWAKSGVPRPSRNVTFIGNNRAPLVGMIGMEKGETAKLQLTAAESPLAAYGRERPRSPVSPVGRSPTPKPDPVAFSKTHLVLSKLSSPNRLCPSTLTSSKVVQSETPDRLKLQSIERWGKKPRPRQEPQQLITKDARYLDYLASTPSFACPTEVEEVKRRYKAASTHAALSQRGMSQHGAQTLSALAQLALQGIASTTPPPGMGAAMGGPECAPGAPGVMYAAHPEYEPTPQQLQYYQQQQQLYYQQQQQQLFHQHGHGASKYLSFDMQDPLVHEAERLAARGSATPHPSAMLMPQHYPTPQHQQQQHPQQPHAAYRHISHPHHQN